MPFVRHNFYMKRENDSPSFLPCFLLWRCFCLRVTQMNNASVFSLHCLSIGALKICFFQYPTLTQQLLFKAPPQCVWCWCVHGSFNSFHVERYIFVPNNSRVKKLTIYKGIVMLVILQFYWKCISLQAEQLHWPKAALRQSEQVVMRCFVFVFFLPSLVLGYCLFHLGSSRLPPRSASQFTSH